jgi:hypothetical protein
MEKNQKYRLLIMACCYYCVLPFFSISLFIYVLFYLLVGAEVEIKFKKLTKNPPVTPGKTPEKSRDE